MKRTFSKILFIAAGVLMASGAFAQNGRFSAGLEAALPMGDLADIGGFGYGATLRYEFPVTDNFGITGTAGYIMFSKKTESIPFFGDFEYQVSMIPIQAGGKFYFQDGQDGFYAGAELGVHIVSTKTTIPEMTIGGVTFGGSETASNTGISYAPGIGYHLANIDIGLRYQLFSLKSTSSYTDPFTGITVETSATSTQGYIGVRLAYVFGER